MRQSSSSESWSRALHERLQSLSGTTIVARQPQVSEFFLASWEKPSADALVILLHSKLLGRDVLISVSWSNGHGRPQRPLMNEYMNAHTQC